MISAVTDDCGSEVGFSRLQKKCFLAALSGGGTMDASVAGHSENDVPEGVPYRCFASGLAFCWDGQAFRCSMSLPGVGRGYVNGSELSFGERQSPGRGNQHAYQQLGGPGDDWGIQDENLMAKQRDFSNQAGVQAGIPGDEIGV